MDEAHTHRDAVEAVLARLQQGPLRAQDCQTLRIASSTLRAAVWKLRRRGYVITADRQWGVAKAPKLYRLESATPPESPPIPPQPSPGESRS